jgi:hypothetical protein
MVVSWWWADVTVVLLKVTVKSKAAISSGKEGRKRWKPSRTDTANA